MLLGDVGVVVAGIAQLAIHLPAHTRQQHAAGEHDADDIEELDGDGGEGDAHDRRGDDAPERIAFLRWSAGRAAAAIATTMALSPARRYR